MYTFLIFPLSSSKNLNHLKKNLFKDFDIESNRTFPKNETASQHLLETKLYSDFFSSSNIIWDRFFFKFKTFSDK